MVRKTNPWLIATILFFYTATLNAVDVSGITIALPSDCNAKLRWVSPPLDSKMIEGTSWYHYNWYDDFCFAVDASGQPWFAIPGRYGKKGIVLNPVKQYRFGLSHPFLHMACLDNGALLFNTDHDLGFISSPETLPVEDGVAVVPFQPAITLPLPDSRIYSGANSALYIVGTADNGNNEVYLLQPEAISQGNQKIIRHFRKLFASQKPIGAVTGDGRTTFIALDRTIVQIQHEGQSQADILVHPTGRIRQLAYSPAAGLFYATNSAVGLVGEHGTWDFLSLDHAQIALRDDSLYVCLLNTLGVVALDNISDLAKYAPNGVYIPQARPSGAVEVTDMKFRAFPVDPNGKAVYGKEFERSDIRRIHGVIWLQPTGEQATHTVLTVDWDGPKDLREDGYMWRRTTTRILDFRDGKDKSWWFSAPFEQTFYPGEYTMKVLVDGIEAGTRSFKITGKTTVKEAALQDNILLLETLLEQGADPNECESDGGTALHISAFNGNAEAAGLLLKYGAQIDAKNDNGVTPLFYNCLGYSANPAGAFETAKLLIKHGADVTTKDRDGYSVLDWSFRSLELGKVGFVDLLLQHGVSVDARGDEGRTLLAKLAYTHSAYIAPFMKGEIAECLIKHGADVSATDNDGESVLTTAVFSGDVGLVRVLLDHGASPSKPDIDEEGDKDYSLLNVRHDEPNPDRILELLLTHGANPNVGSYPGYTALSKAIEETDPASVWILLKYGASLSADCRINYETVSPLRGALSSYIKYAAKDRVKAQKAKDIFFMLLERGAVLRTGEEPVVADKRLHGWLPRELILNVLKRNDQAVLDAHEVTDPRVQSVVINRLLQMARTKTAAATSKDGYQVALALCDQAKTRAQVWKIESQCPLIYYNTGLLYGQLGEISAAKDNFRRYLALVPNAPDAEAIRKSMGL